MDITGFGLIASGGLAALLTLSALQSALDAAEERRWERALWSLLTLAALAAAGWGAALALRGDRPEGLLAAVVLAPLPVTLALIARSWAGRAEPASPAE